MKSQVSNRLNRQIIGRHKSCWTSNICYTAAPPLKSTSRRLHIETSSSHLPHSLAPPEFPLQNVQDIFFYVGGYVDFTLIRNGCWGYVDGTPDEWTTSAPHHEFLHWWNAEYVTHLQHDIRTWLHQNFSSEVSEHRLLCWWACQFRPHLEQDVGGMQMAPQTNKRPAFCVTSSSIGETLSASCIECVTRLQHDIRAPLRNLSPGWAPQRTTGSLRMKITSRLAPLSQVLPSLLYDHWVTFTQISTITERLYSSSASTKRSKFV